MAASTKSLNAAIGTNYNAFGGRLNDISTLNIDNGMTAGYGDNDGNVDNPPAWPGTYGGNPKTAPKRIGVLRNVPGSLPGNKVYSLYFIFNPNQIVASFATNTSSIPSPYLYGSYNDGSAANVAAVQNNDSSTLGNTVPNLTNSQSVSWSLFFDRTYDMLFDPNPDENRGVLRDVAALYNLMGTFTSQGGVPISTPCQVVFAQTVSGQLWGFTGYISSVYITYGIFRHNMIPSRCEVDLQMTTTYVGATAPTNPDSSSTAINANGGAGSTSNVQGPTTVYQQPFGTGGPTL